VRGSAVDSSRRCVPQHVGTQLSRFATAEPAVTHAVVLLARLPDRLGRRDDGNALEAAALLGGEIPFVPATRDAARR
jgi:hypothetical protein